MLVKLSSSALKQTRWYEYGVRFLLGGLATVLTGVVSSRFGVSVGGLFLALPAVFCASATLIESHERRAKEKAGLSGARRAGDRPRRSMRRVPASEALVLQRSLRSSTSWRRRPRSAHSSPPSWHGRRCRSRRGG